MVALTGPLATASRESRQARKGATVVVTLCAEVWLVRVTAIFLVLPLFAGRLCLALESLETLAIYALYYEPRVTVISRAHKVASLRQLFTHTLSLEITATLS